MTQTGLLLLAVAITGIYAVRWTQRLAPLTSELPFKTLLATLLSGWVAIGDFATLPFTEALRPVVLVLGPLYVFAPLALVGLARAGRSRWAWGLARALYWSGDGRVGLRRLLTQVALQRGDVAEAEALAPEDDSLFAAQIRSLQGDWPGVLTLELPREGDNAFLGDAARIRALIAMGRFDEAEGEIAAMERRWEAQGGGPIGYRSVRLGQARLAAERGRFEEAREALQGVSGLPVHHAFEVLSRAAEVRGDAVAAGRLLEQAYLQAPEGFRTRYGEELARRGHTPPKAARRFAPGTLVMVVVLALLFGAQLLLDRLADPVIVAIAGFRPEPIDPSIVASAFVLNLPIPSSDAWWRFLSYAFVHSGWVHIGFNLWVLFDIGRLYERRRGWGNLLAAFAVGTVLGAYLSLIVFRGDVHLMVGASGGVLGVAGALLADALRGRGGGDRALTRGLLQWMALIVLLSVAIPNVSLWGHVGGLVGGLLWGFVRQGLPPSWRFDLFIGGLTLGVLLYALLEVVRLGLTLL